MGIALAIGSVTVFSDYQDSVAATTEEKQTEEVFSKIQSSIFTMKHADQGHTEIELPENIAGTTYQVSLGEQIEITVGSNSYTKNISYSEYTFEGSSRGGTVNLYRRGDKFTLRG